MKVKVKRRVATLNLDKRPIPGSFHETLEDAELIERTPIGAYVKLANGSIVYRKQRDIIKLEEAPSEQSN